MDIGGAIFRTVEVTGAIICLRLVAFHVDHGHVLRVSGAALGLCDDVVQIDVVLEEFPLSDLLLADTTSISLLNPQSHTKR